MRLFIAVELEDGARRSLESVVARFREETVRKNLMRNSRFAEMANVHLTLAFLGETAEDRLAELFSCLGKSSAHVPFDFSLYGVSGFPIPARARVLWAGVGEGAGGLGSLAGAIRRNLSSTFGLEEREYIPHITLCRFRRPQNLNKLEVYGALQDTEIGRCRVNRFMLMKSILRPNGAVHETVRVFSLTGCAP